MNDHLTDDEMTAVPTSTSTDPRVVAILAAADEHVVYLDAVLTDNETIIGALRDGTSWSSPTRALVTA